MPVSSGIRAERLLSGCFYPVLVSFLLFSFVKKKKLFCISAIVACFSSCFKNQEKKRKRTSLTCFDSENFEKKKKYNCVFIYLQSLVPICVYFHSIKKTKEKSALPYLFLVSKLALKKNIYIYIPCIRLLLHNILIYSAIFRAYHNIAALKRKKKYYSKHSIFISVQAYSFSHFELLFHLYLTPVSIRTLNPQVLCYIRNHGR